MESDIIIKHMNTVDRMGVHAESNTNMPQELSQEERKQIRRHHTREKKYERREETKNTTNKDKAK